MVFSESHSTLFPSQTSYWVIVPAAGIGSRMNAALPKQYLQLGEKSILELTLLRLLDIPGIAGIVVAVSANDQYWNNLEVSKNPLIHKVIGGNERCDSVLNALRFLQDRVDPQTWILVHDAARPCIALSSIMNLCKTLAHDDVGGILAIPVSDTIKNVSPNNTILNTVDRRTLWQAQTPQLFRHQLLHDCLVKALDQNANITDEASAVEFCGFATKVVEGRNDNIKITRPDDLLLAQFILHNQEKNP